ncbi:MAG: hypothetical protein GYA12_01330, partial [Chloroflexi bacterium]|nr:hypothetical protein [Chloroflexota bacterium]
MKDPYLPEVDPLKTTSSTDASGSMKSNGGEGIFPDVSDHLGDVEQIKNLQNLIS